MLDPLSRLGVVLVALCCIGLARAEGPDGGESSPLDAAFREAAQVAQSGPGELPLLDQATLRLPEGYLFVPRPTADRVMQAMGNRIDERFLGLVFPASDEAWFVVAEFDPSGYIRDDDARNWNVDELFTSLRDGTEDANEARRRNGFPEIEVVGWVEPPRYDAATHRLVWSMSARNKGDAPGAPQSVNYNTYALGRDGYLTLNLIADLDRIGAYKSHAETLLTAITYNPGKAYADFDAATDRTAEYGLAALVGGAAAKKLGLFALVGAFLAKFGKLFALAAVATAGGLVRLFMRRRADGTDAGRDGQ